VVYGYADVARDAFDDKLSEHYLEFLETPTHDSWTISDDVVEKVYRCAESGDYQNIVFSCGKMGKVMISKIAADRCPVHAIDVGAVLNAIIYPVTKHKPLLDWGMSWKDNQDLQKLSDRFFAACVENR